MIEIKTEGDGPPRNDSWGNWRFVESNFTLAHADGYEVDLEDMKDSSRILDWIAQVSNKTWAEPADIGHLVRAIDELFDLQENVCSFGSDAKLISPRELITRRRREPDLD